MCVPRIDDDDFKAVFFEFVHPFLRYHHWIHLCVTETQSERDGYIMRDRYERSMVYYSWLCFGCVHLLCHIFFLSCTLYNFVNERCRRKRKKQARSNKQTRQSNTTHPRQSLFQRKMSCLGWDMYMYTPTLTCHRTVLWLWWHSV